MLLSHKNKWIFIHVPKTGGSSIVTALEPYCDVHGQFVTQARDHSIPLYKKQTRDYCQHDTIEKVNETLISQNYDPNEYFSFCYIRNPWDHAVSQFYYYHRLIERNPDPMPRAIDVVNNCETVAEYIKSRYYLRPMMTVLNYSRAVSYVCRFENYQQDFDVICDRIGLPEIQLPHKNASKHTHYTDYYDDEAKQIVAETNAEFIEHFGYEFGE
jgi:hypothetical protein